MLGPPAAGPPHPCRQRIRDKRITERWPRVEVVP
jgi:hypothetical protein